MFTADQLVAHLVGDYLLQSDWMAKEKGRNSIAALVHVVFYTLPFVFITRNPLALGLIALSHFIIDRWSLARMVVWAKNRPWPGSRPWSECRETGFDPDTPKWLAVWLLIVVDNLLHILANGVILYFFG